MADKPKEYYVELGRQVEAGQYVRRGTLVISLCLIALAAFYMGRLTASLRSDSDAEHKTPFAGPGNSSQSAPLVEQAEMSMQAKAQALELEQKLAKNPDDAVAWASLGNLYYDGQQVKKAVTAYENSLRLKPDNPDVITDLGTMYRVDHQHDKALELFLKARALNPAHKQSRFNAGIVYYFDMEKKKEAFEMWEEVLAIDPNAKGPDGRPLRQWMDSLK